MKLRKSNEINEVSTNFLNSLTSTAAINFRDQEIVLISGDTVNTRNLTGECLLYFFSENDCMPCVYDNIYEIINLAEKTKNNLYVITTKDRMHDLYLFHKIEKFKNLHFGYIQNSFINKSFFVIKFKSGGISNSYYHVRGQFKATEKYFENVQFIFDKMEQKN